MVIPVILGLLLVIALLALWASTVNPNLASAVCFHGIWIAGTPALYYLVLAPKIGDTVGPNYPFGIFFVVLSLLMLTASLFFQYAWLKEAKEDN